MAIYSLAFLAPPEIKKRLKADRSLGFKSVMLRMIQRFLSTQDARTWFIICIRRSIEAMKVLDDGEDSFDTSKSVGAPVLSFGMGYGEIGENGPERGTGLLGGHRLLDTVIRDWRWLLRAQLVAMVMSCSLKRLIYLL